MSRSWPPTTRSTGWRRSSSARRRAGRARPRRGRSRPRPSSTSNARRCMTRTDAVTAASTSPRLAAVARRPRRRRWPRRRRRGRRAPWPRSPRAAKARERGGALGEQAAAGRGEQQRAHQAGPGQGDLDGDARPERGPDEVAVVDAEVVERLEHVGDRVEARRAAASESPKPRRSRRTASRTPVSAVPLRVPHPAVGDAGVHQHDRGTAPGGPPRS